MSATVADHEYPGGLCGIVFYSATPLPDVGDGTATWADVAVCGSTSSTYGVQPVLTAGATCTFQVDAYDVDNHPAGTTQMTFTVTLPAGTAALDAFEPSVVAGGLGQRMTVFGREFPLSPALREIGRAHV